MKQCAAQKQLKKITHMKQTAETSVIISLWQELRKRLLFWLGCLVFFSVSLLPFANTLFNIFAKPVQTVLHTNQPLIAIGMLTGFWVPIELSFSFALLLSMPILLSQIWLFIEPALKPHEKTCSRFYLFTSLCLFFIGIFFAYTIALPVCLSVLLRATPTFVHVMPDIVNYLHFSFLLLLTFGIACQIPLIILLLCQLHITSIQKLRTWRRYIVIAAFFIAMLLAPDVISQCFLAIPLWLLFELGLLLAKWFKIDKH